MSRDLDYAADILAAARLALSYVEGVAFEKFSDDTATKRISDEFKALHPEIPWRQMAGMRDILVHAYDHVDLDEVRRVVTDDLMKLIAAVELLVQAEG